jgi:hypothetical protein
MDNHEDWVRKVKVAIDNVSKELNADILLYSGDVMSPSDKEFMTLVPRVPTRPTVLFMLTTDGGSADAAYRIARCLQQRYKKVVLFVDSFCKSAGTLIALGADEIVMSDMSELGPLDVQLHKPDELSELTSGLTPIQSLSTLQAETFKTFEHCFLKLRFRSGLQITTRTAADIAARLTIGLFRSVYAQLDPMRLGEYQRAMLIAQHYGTRLARKNLKESSLDKLIADYPSHGFVIDRCEAETLFHKVREPSEMESLLATYLRLYVEEGLGGEEAKILNLTDDDDDNDDNDDDVTQETTNETAAHRSGKVPSPPGSDRHSLAGDGRTQPVRSNHDAPDYESPDEASQGGEEAMPDRASQT